MVRVSCFPGSCLTALGLGKPRLVARATGNETSPWKTGSKALSLPISEVPKEKRPLLSFALWRLHEKGASRWDTERTVVLCDDEHTNVLAKRLGIATKTFDELSNYIEVRKQAKRDREISGDLEVDFGVQKPMAHQVKSHVEKHQYETKVSTVENRTAQDLQEAQEAALQNEAETGICSKTESPANASTKAASVTLLDEQNNKLLPEAPDPKPAETITDIVQPLKPRSDMPASKPSSIREDTVDPQENTEPLHILPMPDTLAESSGKVSQQNQDKRSSADSITREKENDIAAWVQSLTMEPQDHENFDPTQPEPPNLSNIADGLPQEEPAKVFRPLSYRQAVTGKADPPAPKQLGPPFKAAMSTPRHSPPVSPSREASPQKPEMSQDVEDSDEEVVVFSPKAKRLSAQKAQRPQTPNAPPRVSHSRNVSANRPQSRGVNQHQQQPPPGPPPPVIDPDSFGRDLITHPQPNVPRTFSPYGANGRVGNPRHNHHRSHHPRAAGQYAPQKTNAVADTNAPRPNAKSSPEVATVQIASHTMPPDQQEFVAIPQLVNGDSGDNSFLPPTASRSNGSSRVNGTAIRPERPRYSPRGSPRRGPADPEPEVGYILKSGATREATRGKGKLWIP